MSVRRALGMITGLFAAAAAQATDFDVAHIREQGINMIIIPLNQNFGARSRSEESDAAYALQLCASGAGLAGTVALVWPTSDSRTESLGPRTWSGFLRSIDRQWVAMNINKTLHCR